MPNAEGPILIGSLLFSEIDQIDLTGPFEVLPRLPGVPHRIYGITDEPARDDLGLRLPPDAAPLRRRRRSTC